MTILTRPRKKTNEWDTFKDVKQEKNTNIFKVLQDDDCTDTFKREVTIPGICSKALYF